jgi:hypothetical protein
MEGVQRIALPSRPLVGAACVSRSTASKRRDSFLSCGASQNPGYLESQRRTFKRSDSQVLVQFSAVGFSVEFGLPRIKHEVADWGPRFFALAKMRIVRFLGLFWPIYLSRLYRNSTQIGEISESHVSDKVYPIPLRCYHLLHSEILRTCLRPWNDFCRRSRIPDIDQGNKLDSGLGKQTDCPSLPRLNLCP